jgi:two-component system phosphate regulon sensor histidine kinase PhoR
MRPFQKKFSLFLSVIVSSLSTTLFIIFSLLAKADIHFYFLLAFLLTVFIFTNLVLNYANENFIFGRLTEIFSSLIIHRNNKNARKDFPQGNDIITDISDEVKGWMEDRKNEADQLKKLELYRKEYIGNVSHELKTPIFNIQGYILTLLDGGLEDPKVNREYLVRAEKSVERMINIIEDLESISQLETGELIIEPESFDIVSLAKEVCEGQEMKATAKGIILSVKQEGPIYVYADLFRIRQVLTNLIVNSVKYGKEYGETIVRFTEINELVKVEVADNGIGISPEHLPRLFERFYRIDKSRSRDQGGTGLGLSIVKHILEAHGQNINVTSMAGDGATFSFMLKKG